jgi:hypothetical protein
MYRRLVTPLLAIRSCSVVCVVDTSFRLQWYWRVYCWASVTTLNDWCHGPLTVGRTPTSGFSWLFELHQMHGMYRTVVHGRSPSCSPQELVNGVQGNVRLKSWVEFNFDSYRLCITRTERETPIDIDFFKYFFFFLTKYRYLFWNRGLINFYLPVS